MLDIIVGIGLIYVGFKFAKPFFILIGETTLQDKYPSKFLEEHFKYDRIRQKEMLFAKTPEGAEQRNGILIALPFFFVGGLFLFGEWNLPFDIISFSPIGDDSRLPLRLGN